MNKRRRVIGVQNLKPCSRRDFHLNTPPRGHRSSPALQEEPSRRSDTDDRCFVLWCNTNYKNNKLNFLLTSVCLFPFTLQV